MWQKESESAARTESMPEHLASVIWQPLLPEQVALLNDPKKPYLRYYKYLAQGIKDEQIARIEAEQFGSLKSSQTIGNEIGTMNRVLGLGVGSRARDQAILRLVLAEIIDVNEIKIPNEEQIVLRIPFIGDRRMRIFQLYAAGYKTSQIAQALSVAEKTIENEYVNIYDGMGDGLNTDSMLTASLVYLRHHRTEVSKYVPNPPVEKESSYKFSHIPIPEDLPSMYTRQRPVYEFLERFDEEKLKRLCDNLTTAEQQALERFAKTGEKPSDSIYSTQLILGTQSPAEAAILYLANERHLPSPEQFGLTGQQISAYWYYARGKSIDEIAAIYGVPTRTYDYNFTVGNAKLGNSNSGPNASQKSLISLVDRGFPIDELIGDVSTEALSEFLSKTTQYERDILEALTNINYITKSDLGFTKGQIDNRLTSVRERTGLVKIQAILWYKKAKMLNLISQINPIPQNGVKRA